jgi:uncharacterized protein (UPF0276 family)
MPVRPVPQIALSLMPQPAFAAATRPLFAEGLVDAVEWSFDMGWGSSGVPDWLDGLLDDYAEAGALDGHGVSFSLLSSHPRQEIWLMRLREELARRPYRRVSEHLGFMAAGEVRRSSPLPMPRHPEVVRFGAEQADRLAEVVGAPIGLENLATALCIRDATEQGALLDDIVGSTDGWVLLDLHNLWCQAINLHLDVMQLLAGYPLDRVREVHVSGGSWTPRSTDGPRLRRDTHDGPAALGGQRLAAARPAPLPEHRDSRRRAHRPSLR